MKKFAIIEAGRTLPHLAARLGGFSDWMASGLGAERDRVLVVPAFADADLPAPQQLQGVVVTGSHAMVTDARPWMLRLERWLSALVNKGVPVLGVCFGHQILAKALGGVVDYHPRGREVGTVEVHLLPGAGRDSLLSEVPSRFPAQVFHSQSVLQLPLGAKVLAGNDFEPHHAVHYTDRAWGVQFHPEFDARIMRAYITDQADALQKEGLDPAQLLAGVGDTPASAGLLARFARLVLGG